VEKAGFMDISQTLEYLGKILLDGLFGQLRGPNFVEIIKVLIKEIKDKIQFIFNPHNFPQLDDVRVSHFLETLDFSEVDGFVPAVKLFEHPFDGYDLVVVLLYGLVDLSEGPLAHDIHHVIAVHL
jgi:hypothetical protein